MNEVFRDPLAPIVGQAYFDTLVKKSNATSDAISSFAQQYKAELIGAGIGLGIAAAEHAASNRKGRDGLTAGQRAFGAAERAAGELEAAHPSSATASVASAAAKSMKAYSDATAKHPLKTGIGAVAIGAVTGAMIGKQLKAPLAALLK